MDKSSARRILAENLRIIRFVRNLSQEALADLAGLDRSYVGAIERAERNLSLDKIEVLSRALDVGIPDLLREPDRQQIALQVLEAVRNAVNGTRRSHR